MKNTIKTIDLFAGCGGLMDGFEQSKLYTTLACVEWEKVNLVNMEIIKSNQFIKWLILLLPFYFLSLIFSKL